MHARAEPAASTTPRTRCVIATAFAGVMACGIAAAQVVSHVIAGGGGVSHSAGGCRTLEGSIGEAAAGESSGGPFSVHAGYWAGPGGGRRDSLFRNGFEECQ
jgi:hypothetical protein